MSSSDSDDEQTKNGAQTQYMIKPAKGGPSLDTSTWPLLLKVSFGNITQSEAYNIHNPLSQIIFSIILKTKTRLFKLCSLFCIFHFLTFQTIIFSIELRQTECEDKPLHSASLWFLSSK